MTSQLLRPKPRLRGTRKRSDHLMARYSSFAVVGAGYVGLPIIKALIKRNAAVLVLTRSRSKSIPPSAKLVQVDYNDIARVTRTLQEHRVEVVISTLNVDGLSSQNTIGEASKGAGIKLFLPSEFSVPTQGSKAGLFAKKDKRTKYIQSLGIPTCRIYNGFFMEMIPDLVGSDFNGKVNILQSLQGRVPISFTSIEDTAGFVAYILTELHPTHLDYTSFRIQGQSASLVDIAAILGMDIEYVSGNPSPNFDTAGFLQEYFETGAGSTGWNADEDREGEEKAGSSNSVWENHGWKSISDVLLPK
ncbi:hypothetical protein H0H92_004793 [Tricholoma furcatifolium]|nr:hypothetical protein H0H92_004793 [Tricholoma furcatifolium]